MREDVILVTVNYRLGVLGSTFQHFNISKFQHQRSNNATAQLNTFYSGFLSTGSEHLAGNYGMLDLIQASLLIQLV